MGLHNVLFRLSVVLQVLSNVYCQFNQVQPFPFPSGNMHSVSFPGAASSSFSGGNQHFPSGMPAALTQFANNLMGIGDSKMPMVMMPVPSNDHVRIEKREKTKRRHRRHRSKKSKRDKDSRESDESSYKYRRSSDKIKSKNKKLSGKGHQVLTPVVSYITKDGYVVYQKKIQKDQVSDWLDMGKKMKVTVPEESAENTVEASDEKKSKRRPKRRDDSDSDDDDD